MTGKASTRVATELANASGIVEAQARILQACFDALSAEQREGQEGEAIQVIVDKLNDVAGTLRICQVEVIDLDT
jgi:hypothetical protein